MHPLRADDLDILQRFKNHTGLITSNEIDSRNRILDTYREMRRSHPNLQFHKNQDMENKQAFLKCKLI